MYEIIVISIFAVIAFLCFAILYEAEKKDDHELLGYQDSGDFDIILYVLVKSAPKSLLHCFLKKPGKKYIRVYIGDCTVWHSFPGFYRCTTSKEIVFCLFWEKIKYVQKHDYAENNRLLDVGKKLKNNFNN